MAFFPDSNFFFRMTGEHKTFEDISLFIYIFPFHRPYDYAVDLRIIIRFPNNERNNNELKPLPHCTCSIHIENIKKIYFNVMY